MIPFPRDFGAIWKKSSVFDKETAIFQTIFTSLECGSNKKSPYESRRDARSTVQGTPCPVCLGECREAIKAIGGTTGTSYLDFLMASSAEGSCPTLPVVDIVQGASPQKTIRFYGRAIFNHDYQLVGYLNFVEGAYRQWILKRIHYFDLVENIPEAGGSVGVIVTKFGSKVKSSISPEKKVKMEIELTGLGHVGENNTNLDFSQQKNLKFVQNKINIKTSEHVLEMITKVQKQFGTDVFGFNQTFNRQHPSEWNKLKGQWDTIFPDIEVTINVNVNIKYIGLVGPPLQFKESEINK